MIHYLCDKVFFENVNPARRRADRSGGIADGPRPWSFRRSVVDQVDNVFSEVIPARAKARCAGAEIPSRKSASGLDAFIEQKFSSGGVFRSENRFSNDQHASPSPTSLHRTVSHSSDSASTVHLVDHRQSYRLVGARQFFDSISMDQKISHLSFSQPPTVSHLGKRICTSRFVFLVYTD